MKTSRTLYKESASLFKAHWKKLIGLLAIFFIANMLLSGVGSLSEALLKGVSSGSFGNVVATLLALVAIAFIIAQALASWYLSLLGSVAPIRAVAQHDAGHNPTIKHVIKESVPRVFPYFWVTVLLVLASVPFFLLLVIPGIYVSTILSFALYANILDGKKGLHALAYSRALVVGRFWNVFGKSLMAVVYMIPALLTLGVAAAATAFAYMKFGPVWAYVAGIVLGVPAIVYAVRVGVIATVVYLYKLYRNLEETVSPGHIVTPRWLKVSPWVGLAVVVIGLLGLIAFNVTGELRDGRGESRDSRYEYGYEAESVLFDAPTVSENPDGSSTFSDEGISFTYPADVTYIDAAGSGDQTIAVFVDTDGYENESDEAPYVSVARFPGGEPQGIEALLSATREYYEANAEDQGITYSIERGEVNGVLYVEVEQSVASEKRVGKAVYIETPSALYTFAGSTLAGEKARLDQIFGALLSDIQIAR